ncbi:hypothetical protein L13192_02320 [Pyrenophora tritici-repentis]|nr:hypothetical protein L13192_02320 [Pyrenophora tritici-repentis]
MPMLARLLCRLASCRIARPPHSFSLHFTGPRTGHFSSTGKLASSSFNPQPVNMAILGQSEASNMGRGAYDTTGTVKQPEQPRPTK